MCPIKIFVCVVIHIITVSSSLTHAAEAAGSPVSEAAPRPRSADDPGASDDLLSRVLGVPGVWWPAAQVTIIKPAAPGVHYQTCVTLNSSDPWQHVVPAGGGNIVRCRWSLVSPAN